MAKIIYSALIASLGAFLFGYHVAIIAGADLFIAEEFQLKTFQQEWTVSIVLIGCLIGSLCASISDYLGRKSTLFLTALLYLLATLCLYTAVDFHMLLIGRFVVGIAIGIASVAVPLYISEISPPKNRGALVAINQLMIMVGVVVSYLVSYLFSSSSNWRAMFACAFIPALLQFIGLFFIPDTSFRRDKKSSFRALLNPIVRTPFIIGVGLSLFQQVTGISTVIAYAPRIFELAGFSSTGGALAATFWLGVVLVLTTLLGLLLIDQMGRRLLSLIGIAGMVLSLFILGGAFLFHVGEMGLIAIISLIAYISFFSGTLGMIVIIAEIYPLGIRGRAMSIVSSVNWAANFAVSLTFLTLIQLLGIGGAYWMYALICLLAFLFVWKKVPETKGKTLEEIQKFWQK